MSVYTDVLNPADFAEHLYKISVLLRQIAGAVARRIVTYATVGNSVITAEDLGFIKFGSRVDVFLPIDTKVCTKINQKVKGGLSVIAIY